MDGKQAGQINELDSVLTFRIARFALSTAVSEVSASDSPQVNLIVEDWGDGSLLMR